MTNSQRLANVREFFTLWLARSAEEASLEDAGGEWIESESILIRDGFYCGRRFQAADCHATWFMEEDELKIHGRGGAISAVFRGDEIGDLSLLPEPVLPTPVLPTPVAEQPAEIESVAAVAEDDPPTEIASEQDEEAPMPLIALDPTQPAAAEPSESETDHEDAPQVVSITTPIETPADREKTTDAPAQAPAASAQRDDDEGPSLPITKAA